MDAIFKGLAILLVSACALLSAGCAYTVGSAKRSIPGGYQQISIPIFKNTTQEVGVETAFTNALIQEFQRSKVARVVDNSLSEVAVVGSLDSILYLPSTKIVAGDANAPYLPNGTVLAADYNVVVSATVRLVRQADGTVLWSGTFSSQGNYAAPQVTLAGVNSVNPLYNLSARRQNIESLATVMMIEAHDRITENF